MFSCFPLSSHRGGQLRSTSREPTHDAFESDYSPPSRQHAPSVKKTTQEQASQTPWPAYLAAAAGDSSTRPADASTHQPGALGYEDLSVLHYFQGGRCDILFTNARFQGPSVAALLREVLGRHSMGSEGAGQQSDENGDESRGFLEVLLGSERAQVAEAAVLQGRPFMTVIKRKLPVCEVTPPSTGSVSDYSSLPQSAAKLAKVTLSSDQPSSRLSISSHYMQTSSGGKATTFKVLSEMKAEEQQQQQQQQQSTGEEVSSKPATFKGFPRMSMEEQQQQQQQQQSTGEEVSSKPVTFKGFPRMSMEQQQQQQQRQQQSTGEEMEATTENPSAPKDSAQQPQTAEGLSEPLMPLPTFLLSRQSTLTTLTENSPWHPLHDSAYHTDQQYYDRSNQSAVRMSTPSISHPLRAGWSSGSSSKLPPAYSLQPPAPNPNLPHIVSASSEGQHQRGLTPSLTQAHSKEGQHSTGELRSTTCLTSSSPFANQEAVTSEIQPAPMGQDLREDQPMQQQEAAHAILTSTSSPGMPPTQVEGGEPRAFPTANCRRSKTQPVLSSPLLSLLGEPLSSKVYGEFDRTLALLQAIQLERSSSSSNQALPDLSATSAAGGATGRKPCQKEDPCINVTLPHQDGPAVDYTSFGLHIGDLAEEELMATRLKSYPASLYSAARPRSALDAGEARSELPEGTQERCRERASEEEPCALATCGNSPAGECVRPDSGAQSSSEDLEELVFEVSIRSLLSTKGKGWRKAVGLVSFVDVTATLQAQAALLSLAENQLSLLSSFLPKHAIEFLARRDSNADTIPENVGKLARSHRMVTVLFMDICGFTSICKSIEPQSVLEMLNVLFSRIDKLTDQYKVHKVETAGDCYIVSAGILSDKTSSGFWCTLDNHDELGASARRVMEFAKAVLQETSKVKMPNSSDPMQMRVGIHTGDVVSGLVGSKLPKFSIFGDTMNTAARMESTGKPGRIHVSETTQGLLPEYAWEKMGKINIKGKGMMQTYLWDPTRGWSQQAQQQQQQQQRQQQVAQGESPGSEIHHGDATEPLALAINVLKGLTAIRSKSSHELGKA